MLNLSCHSLSPWLDLEGRFSRNLRKALLFSLLVHVLLGLYLLSERRTRPPVSSELEVILVNTQSRVAPDKPEALAQVALQGGGEHERGRAKSPVLSQSFDRTQPIEQTQSVKPLQSSQQLEVSGKQTSQQQVVEQKLAALEAFQKRLKSEVQQPSIPQNSRQQTPGKPLQQVAESNSSQQQMANSQQEMSAAAQEIARLEAQVAQQLEDYNKRPRQHFFSPSTSPYVFAMYEDHWRRKIERYGNLNYPAEARGKIYGALRLTVYIKKDGTVHQVELDQSSGSPVLDRAAMRIARLAAPYGEFSPEMLKMADILVLTRTWIFTNDALQTRQR